MARYRIQHRYPYYNGCIPIDIWVVQRLQEGFFRDKWVDIKGFDTPDRARQLLKILEQYLYEKIIHRFRAEQETC